MTAPQVSYLVTSFNKAAVLGETLAAIRAQSGGASCEIVCVDDGSTDGSRALLAAEAARDPRLRVLGDAANRGPAIRINQAAQEARGAWLHPVDGDDLLPPNATQWLMAQARRCDAPLVFGRATRGLSDAPIPDSAESRRVTDPLRFTARRQITHMGFLCTRALWMAAGGADEGVFIQDQSLPLRLSAHAPALAWTSAVVYRLRPAGDASLSRNVAQQHHDRYLSALHLMRDHPEPALAAMMLSALWKLRRDGFGGGGAPALSADFARYALNKALGWAPPLAWFEARAARLAALPGVRRP